MKKGTVSEGTRVTKSLGGSCAYPFGPVLDIPVGEPELGEHPQFKSDGRVNGLFQAPDQPPMAQEV